MHSMFCGSVFNGDVSKWNILSVVVFDYMFCCTMFNCDISLWQLKKINDTMFIESSIQKSFKPVKRLKIYNLKIIKNDCMICWESNIHCYILNCFQTHIVCINCINNIKLCPLCSKLI